MGADGGVAVLHVVGDVARVRELLHPWIDYLENLDGASSYGDDSRYLWMCENGSSAQEIVGAYGTDCSQWLQLNYLEEFLAGLEDLLSCEARGVGQNATFADLFMERSTRHFDLSWYESACYKAWVSQIKGYSDYRHAYPAAGPTWNEKDFLNQKIKPWMADLRKEITGKPDGFIDVITIETWT